MGKKKKKTQKGISTGESPSSAIWNEISKYLPFTVSPPTAVNITVITNTAEKLHKNARISSNGNEVKKS